MLSVGTGERENSRGFQSHIRFKQLGSPVGPGPGQLCVQTAGFEPGGCPVSPAVRPPDQTRTIYLARTPVPVSGDSGRNRGPCPATSSGPGGRQVQHPGP